MAEAQTAISAAAASAAAKLTGVTASTVIEVDDVGAKSAFRKLLAKTLDLNFSQLTKAAEVLITAKKAIVPHAVVSEVDPRQGNGNKFERDHSEEVEGHHVPGDLIVAAAGSVAMALFVATKDHHTKLLGELSNALQAHPQVLLVANQAAKHYVKALIGLIAALAMRRLVMVWWSNRKSPIGAKWRTRVITTTLDRGILRSAKQRQIFRNCDLVRPKLREDHPHPQSAASRAAAQASAQFFARSIGKEPYMFQQSKKDQEAGTAGDRSLHWGKDIELDAREYAFDASAHVGILIDVDYYMDMPSVLARHPGTYVLYTFQPCSAARSTGEYTYRFNSDQTVKFSVKNGGEYRHELWDYSGDTLLVQHGSYVNKTVVAYHIDRKRVDDDHILVLLSVIGQFKLPTIVPTHWVIDGNSLKRLHPVYNEHVILDVMGADGQERSVACLGDYTAVTLARNKFDALHALALSSKNAVTPSMVSTAVSGKFGNGVPNVVLADGHAHILATYLRGSVPTNVPVVYPPSASIVPVHFGRYDYDAQIYLEGFGSPMVQPSYTFRKSIATDDQCIRGRIEQFQRPTDGKAPQSSNMPPQLAKYMQEFVEFLIPAKQASKGVPVEEEVVLERQDRPSQRHLLAEAALTGQYHAAHWALFGKKEAYMKPTDPRPISQATPKVKLHYSRFMYAFHEDVMANMEWYAFNKTPRECAERITGLLKQATHCVVADGSRFDGHVLRFARALERIYMFRWVRQDLIAELNDLLNDQIGLPGHSSEGRKYNSCWARGSGSLETSDFNSILCAFIDYCAWRDTTVGGFAHSPREAWERLGIYGGDDSVSGPVSPQALKLYSDMMGQSYDIEVYQRGQPGVNFLNRHFGPGVWEGDPNSMSNPLRALMKLFTGPIGLTNVLQRFAERMSGYYRMDRNTPVLGPLTEITRALLGERDGTGKLAPWYGRFSVDTNWPNSDDGDWMTDMFDNFIPDFDWGVCYTWFDSLLRERDPNLLLRAPMCTPLKTAAELLGDKGPTAACVVGDEHLVPATQDEDDDNEVVTVTSSKEKLKVQAEAAAAISALLAKRQFEEVDLDANAQAAQALTIVDAAPKQVSYQNDDDDSPPARAAPSASTQLDPRSWVKPIKGPSERDEQYAIRLNDWTRYRAKKMRQINRTKAELGPSAAKDHNSQPLVGIELNPGPLTGEQFLAFMHYRTRFSHTRYIVVKHGVCVELEQHAAAVQCLRPSEIHAANRRELNIAILKFIAGPQPPLVGVEPNPGPPDTFGIDAQADRAYILGLSLIADVCAVLLQRAFSDGLIVSQVGMATREMLTCAVALQTLSSSVSLSREDSEELFNELCDGINSVCDSIAALILSGTHVLVGHDGCCPQCKLLSDLRNLRAGCVSAINDLTIGDIGRLVPIPVFHDAQDRANLEPPAPPLVGIEPNPGPSAGSQPASNLFTMPPKRKTFRRRPVTRRAGRTQRRRPARRTTRRTRPGVRAVAAAYGNVNRLRAPKFSMRGDVMIVEHEEYVGDVFADHLNVFAYDTYDVNIANANLFPWLSGFATRFESFRLEHFEPKFKSYSPSNTSGQVVLSMDFDANDPTISATKAELLNTGYATDCAMWENVSLKTTEAQLNKVGPTKFVNQNLSLDADKRLSTSGTLYVATSPTSAGAGAGLGELWVSYVVQLHTPVITAGVGMKGYDPSQGTQFNIGTGTATTDVIPQLNPARFATLSAVPGATPSPLIMDVGAGTEIWQDGPSLQAGPWLFAGSGSPVPAAQSVIAFAKDFVGRIALSVSSGTGTVPYLPNMAFGACTKNTLGASGIAIAEIISAVATGTIDKLAYVIFDVVAAAGSGFALTAPSYTQTLSAAYSYVIDAVPSVTDVGVVFMAKAARDMRQRIKAKAQKAETESDDDSDDALQKPAPAQSIPLPTPTPEEQRSKLIERQLARVQARKTASATSSI